jgi:hypothetical protein
MNNNNQTIPSYSEGDKITWTAIVGGKEIHLTGDVSSITGETMCCIGKCQNGDWWRDDVSIYNLSVAKINH